MVGEQNANIIRGQRERKRPGLFMKDTCKCTATLSLQIIIELGGYIVALNKVSDSIMQITREVTNPAER